MLRRGPMAAVLLALVATFLPPAVPPARAATITVTTVNDELTTNGLCSLREAIRNANAAGRPHPDCTAGTGSDTITLTQGTFQLTISGRLEDAAATGDLDVTRTLTILGATASTTRIVAGPTPGSGLDRVFDVRQGASLTLRNVGVGNGNAGTDPATAPGGGAIQAGFQSTLVVEDAAIFDSLAVVGGGVFGDGASITLRRTTFSGNLATANGGGITANLGTLTVLESTIRNNASNVVDGGISSNGTDLTVTDSTIRDNAARTVGGGLTSRERNGTLPSLRMTGTTVSGNRLDPSLNGQANGSGAGLSLGDTTSTIVNSTISGNLIDNATVGQGGGLRAVGGSLTLVQSTIALNEGRGDGGGGLFVTGTVDATVRGTIIARNRTGGGAQDNCSGTVDTSASNLTDSPPGADDCGFTSASDLRGVDPRLGALADNGGQTQTHAIGIGSPAIDRIQAFSIAGRGRLCETYAGVAQTFTDQRGQPRGADGDGDGSARCDVGAFERQRPGIGVSELSPAEAAVAPGQTITYTFPWDVPGPKNWHDLARLELRFRDAAGVALHIRWNEFDDTFQLVNPDGSLGPAFPGGSNQTLTGPLASLDLRGVRTQGSGPTGPSVALTLPVTFSQAADGRAFAVEVLAAEDTGAVQGLDAVGRVTVGSVAGYDPNNDRDGRGEKDDKDKPARETETERRQRERTNQLGLDDDRTEGNAVATRCDASPPEVDIANRDGTVTLVLLGEAASACGSVKAGAYLEAEGTKLHEQRYEVDSLSVR